MDADPASDTTPPPTPPKQPPLTPQRPSSPSSLSSSPHKHSRDPSLQQILHQFDPLTPSHDAPLRTAAGDSPPAPPPKDKPSPLPAPVSPTRPEVPEKDHHVSGESSRASFTLKRRASILSIERPPPAEPDQPFEFQRFLEQMRHKSADGVARYMKRCAHQNKSKS
jgi:Rab5 GDP/GTP exchange factor